MNERKVIKNILKRLGYKILYEDQTTIESESDSYDGLNIEFDEDGKVTAIY